MRSRSNCCGLPLKASPQGYDLKLRSSLPGRRLICSTSNGRPLSGVRPRAERRSPLQRARTFKSNGPLQVSIEVHLNGHGRGNRNLAKRPTSFDWPLSLKVTRTQTTPSAAQLKQLCEPRRRDGRAVLSSHERAWFERWRLSDIEIDGDAKIQKALRFATYHLISAVNPDDERVSIGARALTGDAYLGHVFWDTEIYLLPFYVFTWPEAARALLMYRFHTLPGARAKAAKLGYRGALYAWELTDTGEETTPEKVIGLLRAASYPSYAALRSTTSAPMSPTLSGSIGGQLSDDEFFLAGGAEILLETARFWASRATLESDGRYHIRGVIGPDEYHETIDDNAFTNVMAAWNIERGLDVIAALGER